MLCGAAWPAQVIRLPRSSWIPRRVPRDTLLGMPWSSSPSRELVDLHGECGWLSLRCRMEQRDRPAASGSSPLPKFNRTRPVAPFAGAGMSFFCHWSRAPRGRANRWPEYPFAAAARSDGAVFPGCSHASYPSVAGIRIAAMGRAANPTVEMPAKAGSACLARTHSAS